MITGIPFNKGNITLKNVKSFLQSKWRRIFMNTSFINIIEKHNISEFLSFPLYKQEQTVYRAYILETHAQGSLCVKNNICPCECTTSDVIISDEACHMNCFPKMLSEIEWEMFKKQNKFYVDLLTQKIIKYVD